MVGHKLRALLRSCHGGLFLETVVAVTVFTLLGTAVLSGLSTVLRSGARTEYQSIAENIARNQMEYVFAQPYQAPPSTYPSVTVPANYTVTAVAEEYVVADSNVEKVVVTVNYAGQYTLVVETLRTR